VYYKGCGGITVSPTSNRIVIARTGGRTLGVLNYKDVGSACQGQVVDAISTYRGKKFNSPTYAEYAQNGILYFTDSPFGLATSDADFDGDTLDKSPLREIPSNGVYMLRNGSGKSVELVDCEMPRPNKIAFSPSQEIMYITNSQKGNSYVKSYVLADDGSASNSSIFFNFTAHPELQTGNGFAKGIKVDDNGYVYVVCYKGVYIFSPEGEMAGAIMSSEELDSVSMGLGRLFISGSFGLVAQTSGVPYAGLPNAQTTCSAR
jgi:gluconolactonase